jgi:hypothetical protein
MNELKQIVFTIFNTQVKDADVYYNNGSTWLIFTNKKKWVFELTKEGTLWYNYYFFKNFFELLSLDVIENQNYITEWVGNTIQNGVKYTQKVVVRQLAFVDDTIQNGVKETKHNPFEDGLAMEEAIQNGVKETKMEEHHRLREVVQTVNNGVKKTNWRKVDNHPTFLDDIIKSNKM